MSNMLCNAVTEHDPVVWIHHKSRDHAPPSTHFDGKAHLLLTYNLCRYVVGGKPRQALHVSKAAMGAAPTCVDAHMLYAMVRQLAEADTGLEEGEGSELDEHSEEMNEGNGELWGLYLACKARRGNVKEI